MVGSRDGIVWLRRERASAGIVCGGGLGHVLPGCAIGRTHRRNGHLWRYDLHLLILPRNTGIHRWHQAAGPRAWLDMAILIAAPGFRRKSSSLLSMPRS